MSEQETPDPLPRGIGRAATAALEEAGVTTLSEVARWSAAELLALHGVGPKAVRVLREALARRGEALEDDASHA